MTDVGTWRERAPLTGDVDFTMMYVAHDAFVRDLHRLVAAGERGRGHTAEAHAAWRLFATQLHIHHTVEDTSLWPRLRAVVTAPEEIAVLDAMDAEHAEIDPLLHRVEAAIADHDDEGVRIGLGALAARLTAHMQHEETEALPLVAAHLGRRGWAAFGADIRRTQGGIRGGAVYLPWVLDGASRETKARVLKLLPPPARVLYRRMWVARYEREHPAP